MNKFLRKAREFKFELILFFIFVAYRLPLLGADFMNTDAPRWKRRAYVFSSAVFSGDFALTNITYHPGVTLMWLLTLAIKINNVYQKIFWGYVDVSTFVGFITLHFWEKLVLIIFISVVLCLSIYILKKLYGLYFAILFFVIFTFEPLSLAYTRTIHTDALVAFLVFFSSLALYYSYKVKNRSLVWVFLSALSAALAILTKSNALIILPFSGLIIFVQEINSLKIGNFILILKKYSIWLIMVVVLVFVIWPALWVSPKETVNSYIHGITDTGIEDGHDQKWFGEGVEDPGWLFYPVVFFIMYSPLFVFLSSTGAALYKISVLKTKKIDKLLLLSLAFILLYLLMMSFPSKKLDRYLFPIIPFMAIFATYAIEISLRVIKKHRLSMVIFVSSMIFTYTFLETYKSFPNYISYYSPLIGGYEGGKNIINPKWSWGHRELYTYLNSQPDAIKKQVFLRKPFVYDEFLLSYAFDIDNVNDLAQPGDYFILKGNEDWVYLNDKPHQFLKTVKVGDIDYFWVFQFK